MKYFWLILWCNWLLYLPALVGNVLFCSVFLSILRSFFVCNSTASRPGKMDLLKWQTMLRCWRAVVTVHYQDGHIIKFIRGGIILCLCTYNFVCSKMLNRLKRKHKFIYLWVLECVLRRNTFRSSVWNTFCQQNCTKPSARDWHSEAAKKMLFISSTFAFKECEYFSYLHIILVVEYRSWN